MKKTKKLVIYGTGEFASMAYEYFTRDSAYDVIAFTVERAFLTHKELEGLPVIPFETIKSKYPPRISDMFVAVSYAKLNRVRAKFYELAKHKGYRLPTFISSHALVWPTAKIGDNCMIFENNVIQHGVTIGNDVYLWSGNHIGHRAVIKNHVYISSHCVISGYTSIGAYSFLGVNSTFNERLVIAPDTFVGSGAVVINNTEKGKVYVGNPAKPLEKTSYEVAGIKT